MDSNHEPRSPRVLKRFATFIGRVAGSIEGSVEAVRDAHPPELQHHDVEFEHSELNARGTFLTGVGVIVGLWIISGLIFLCFSFLRHHRAEVSSPPLPIAEHGNPLPPEPRLQNSPPQDLKALRAREDWEMNHYYWINKDKGEVAIPIEQAMQIIAKHGIPPQNTPPNATLTPPQAGTRTTGFEGEVEPEPR